MSGEPKTSKTDVPQPTDALTVRDIIAHARARHDIGTDYRDHWEVRDEQCGTMREMFEGEADAVLAALAKAGLQVVLK